MPSPSTESTTALAARVAATRRALMSLWSGEAASALALDLMGIEGTPVPANLAFAAVVIESQLQTLRGAELFLADTSMCELIDTAAPKMPDQVLRTDDPLAPSGLLAFAAPLADRTDTGLVLPIVGMTWQVLGDGHPTLNQTETGVGPSVLLTSYVSTADVAAAQGGGEIRTGLARWLPSATVMWEIGTEIGSAYGGKRDVPVGMPGFYQQLVAAFWTLVKQPKLTERSDELPPKPERRRFERAGIERPSEPVHVVRLARRQPRAVPSGESRPVDWQHQWIVAGHWRDQWLPSTKTHRQQWIAPYPKGPEDKPFIGTEKVFLVSGRGVEPPSS